jgi:general L-amino acid transport system substrate-binding protein
MLPHLKEIVLGSICLVSLAPFNVSADTLSDVKQRGALNCTGHNGSFPGFAEVDDQGNWKGFDIDLCRGLATAIFGTYKDHLNIKPTSWAQRWPNLKSKEVDIIIKASGWTMGRDTDVGLQFSRTYMMAPATYMVHTSIGASSPKDLDGGTLCVQSGTTYERYAADHMAANAYTMEVVPFEKTEEAKEAYESGRCDAYIGASYEMAAMRANDLKKPEEHQILPQPLAAEPLAMIMRQGDDRWVDISNWLLSVLIMAEEAGITSENVDEMKANPATPGIAKMLGATPGLGARLGLDDDWGYNVIKTIGNYDQVYQRNLGDGSVYKLERGINGLMRDGGVFYSLILD